MIFLILFYFFMGVLITFGFKYWCSQNCPEEISKIWFRDNVDYISYISYILFWPFHLIISLLDRSALNTTLDAHKRHKQCD